MSDITNDDDELSTLLVELDNDDRAMRMHRNEGGLRQLNTLTLETNTSNLSIGRNPVLASSIGQELMESGTFTRPLRSNKSLRITTATSTDEEGFGTPGQVDANEFRLASTSTSTLSNRSNTVHNIFIFPSVQSEMDCLCLKHIAVGVTACVRKNCTINHRGWNGKRQFFKTGTIAVAKDKNHVFVGPYSNVDNISDEVLSQWRTEAKHSLDEWSSMFRVAESTKDNHGYVTVELMDAEKTYHNYATRYKSPRASGSRFDDTLSPESKFSSFKSLADQLYKSLKRKSIDFINENAQDMNVRRRILLTGDEDLPNALYKLETAIESISNIIGSLSNKLDDKNESVKDEIKILLTRAQAVESFIGHRIETNNASMEAPTLWGAVALLTSALEDVQFSFGDQIQEELVEMKNLILPKISELEMQMAHTLRESIVLVQDQVKANQKISTDRQKSISDSVVHLARKAVELKNEVREIKDLSRGRDDADNATGNSAIEIAQLKSVVHELTNRLDLLVEDRASKAVKFFGITLRNNTEANQWAIDNLDEDALGVIVDVHLVLEHIFHQSFAGEGVLKTLQLLYKVKIDTITQGLACSSFDSRIPKFFHSGIGAGEVGKGKKMDPNRSALDVIKTWDDWDQTSSGFRTLLESQLIEFKKAHTMVLNETMIPGTPAYNVSMLSVAACTNWISALVAYIDRTYREFRYDGGFTTERSWHIVTHLVFRIFVELSEPRVGTSKLLKLVNNQKTIQLILWPTVQCHEVMKRFEQAGFKDDPCVASEYVKFIMKNSASDSLSLQVTTMEGEIKELSKAMKGATSSAATASNVASEAKKLATDLGKRVDKVEKK